MERVAREHVVRVGAAALLARAKDVAEVDVLVLLEVRDGRKLLDGGGPEGGGGAGRVGQLWERQQRTRQQRAGESPQEREQEQKRMRSCALHWLDPLEGVEWPMAA